MIIDLTHPIEPTMQIYPGDAPFAKGQLITVSKEGFSVQLLHLGTHAGTHIDAPSHRIEGGQSVDRIDLDELVGRAFVIDLTRVGVGPREEIDLKKIEKHLP